MADVNIKKYKSIKDNALWSISVVSVCVRVCGRKTKDRGKFK